MRRRLVRDSPPGGAEVDDSIVGGSGNDIDVGVRSWRGCDLCITGTSLSEVVSSGASVPGGTTSSALVSGTCGVSSRAESAQIPPRCICPALSKKEISSMFGMTMLSWIWITGQKTSGETILNAYNLLELRLDCTQYHSPSDLPVADDGFHL